MGDEYPDLTITDLTFIDGGLVVSSYTAFERAVAKGLGFVWNKGAADAIGATETVLLVANDNPNYDLIIHDLRVQPTATSDTVQWHLPTYATPAGGDLLTGVNLNRTSNNPALATVYLDETGQGTQGTIVYTSSVADDAWIGLPETLRDKIRLGYHQSFAADFVTGQATCFSLLLAYFVPCI